MGHHLFSSSICLYSYSTVVSGTMISCGGASGVYKCVRTCSYGGQSTIFDDISHPIYRHHLLLAWNLLIYNIK